MIFFIVVGVLLVLVGLLTPHFPTAAVLVIVGMVQIIVAAARAGSSRPAPSAPPVPSAVPTPPPVRAAPAATPPSPPPSPEPPRPAAPTVATAPPAPAPKPTRSGVIVTRTNNRSGPPLVDPYAGVERAWTRDETRRALELLDDGTKIAGIAEAMRIDQRQVAIHLVRTLFHVDGAVDDESRAPRHGSRYSADEVKRIRAAHLSGIDLPTLATGEGRTPLGAGWRLIDSRPQVVYST